ncbi:hypothetical protein CBR_g39613 [Chara braunii]|uniref:Myb/SANT-like DNA-binding domain-containing protein n=1 Tax=Chara braunii TaxID=69332 RepID=A0A388K1B3_CHABU|nr:hypothetical protein CBR_g39613 [Chara braunii]|eukprot:GBG63828.1 hypothetical protein CBR_g39613 [Chara braunii]
MLSQTVRVHGSVSNEGGEFASLLRPGLGNEDDEGLHLRFGLSSGSTREVTHTFIVDVDPSPRGIQRCGSQHAEKTTLRGGASVTAAVGPSPPTRQHGSTAASAERMTSTCPVRSGITAGSPLFDGGQSSMANRTTLTQADARDEPACKTPVRPGPTVENITLGVSNMRAHSDGGDDNTDGGDDADEGLRTDVEPGDDDEDIQIRDDGGKSVTYWSTEDQLLLVRSKRGQNMHLAGLAHNYGRMKTKDWKWEDIAKRMANAGRPKDVDECIKKWDNLFQNYKKIQRFQNASGMADFFRLSNEERKENNFKFRMDRVLYNEIHGGMLGNHTIFPPNVADTGSPDGVQLPRQGATGGESVGSEAGGDGCPEELPLARDSDNNAGTHEQTGGGLGGGCNVAKAKWSRQDAASVSGTKVEGDGWGRPGDNDDNDVFTNPDAEIPPPVMPANVHERPPAPSLVARTHTLRIINTDVNEVVRVDNGQGDAMIAPVTTPQGRNRPVAGIGPSATTQEGAMAATSRKQVAGDECGSGGVRNAGAAGDQAQTRLAGVDVDHVEGTPRGTGEEDRRHRSSRVWTKKKRRTMTNRSCAGSARAEW